MNHPIPRHRTLNSRKNQLSNPRFSRRSAVENLFSSFFSSSLWSPFRWPRDLGENPAKKRSSGSIQVSDRLRFDLRTKRCSSLSVGPLAIQQITINARWSANGTTVMGGHGPGNEPNQLHNPGAIDIDREDTIYVTDDNNHRIMEKKSNSRACRVVAGGNGPGSCADQLNVPTGILVEKMSESLIVCDHGNERLMRWSLRTGTSEEMILGEISCRGLAMDANRFLYVSSDKKSEIRRFRLGERNGTVMADGDGKANSLDRFLAPNFFTFDDESSLYISDVLSNRVTKWTPGAKEGIVVAGNSDEGAELDQLSRPFGIVVDRLKTVYVVDSGNHRVMRWSQNATNGETIIGGNGRGMGANQLNNPVDIAMDRQGNLFVTDYNNHRVQKFLIEQY